MLSKAKLPATREKFQRQGNVFVFWGQALGIYFLLIFEGEVDADDSVDCAVVYRRIPVL